MSFSLAEAYIQLDTKGATGVFGMLDKVTGKLTALGQLPMNQLTGKISGIKDSILDTLNPVKMLTMALGALGTGAGIAEMIGMAAKLEQTKTDFDQLTRSAEATDKLLGALKQQFAGTNISSDEYKEAAKEMLSMGEKAEDIPAKLFALGNVSSATGVSLQGMSSALRRAEITGKVSSRTIMAMPPQLMYLAEAADAGQVTVAKLREELQKLGGEGGQFGGKLAADKATLVGQWDIAKGKLSKIFTGIGQDIITGFDLPGVVGRVSDWLGWFQETYGNTIKRVFVAIGDVAKSVFSWIGEHKVLVGTIAAVGGAMVGVALASTALSIGLSVLGASLTFVGGGFAIVRTALGLVSKGFSVVANVVGTIVSTAFDVLAGAVNMAFKGLSMLSDFIGGVLNAGLWVLNTTISTLTTVWDALKGVVAVCKSVLIGFAATGDLIIDTMAAIGGAITSLIAMGPMLIAIAPLALAAGWWATSTATEMAGKAADKAGKALKNAGDTAQQALTAVGDSGRQAMAGVGDMAAQATASIAGYAEGVHDFAGKVANTATAVFQTLWADVKVGFNNVVKDVGDSWKDIQALIQQGDFSGAWKVGLAIMKLEWARFSGWFQEEWNNLIPTLNTMVGNIAKVTNTVIAAAGTKIGEIRSQIEVVWGDISDKFLGILHTTLEAVDGMVDNVRQMIKDVLVKLGLNEEHHYFWFDDKLKEIEHSHLADTIGQKPRTQEQKAADDKAAKEKGDKLKTDAEAAGKAMSDAIVKHGTIAQQDPKKLAADNAARINALTQEKDAAAAAGKQQVGINQDAINKKKADDEKAAKAARDKMIKGGVGGGAGGGGIAGAAATAPQAAFTTLTGLAEKLQMEADKHNTAKAQLQEQMLANKHLNRIAGAVENKNNKGGGKGKFEFQGPDESN